jgi:hypothetical protein
MTDILFILLVISIQILRFKPTIQTLQQERFFEIKAITYLQITDVVSSSFKHACVN